ncbi:MAG: hemerythrin domain-containing protein [Bacteroidota bacterium]|jgi:hypothetical protein
MSGKLHKYFTEDHRRLDELLRIAIANPDTIDEGLYGQFRSGLLKHIAMEEKIVFPAAQRHRGGKPLPIAAKLRLDHGAIAALLVPPPSRTIVAALGAILEQHDVLEEMPGGAYEVCEQLAADELESVMDAIRRTPDGPANPYNPNPSVLDATRRALARAGYDLDDYQISEK